MSYSLYSYLKENPRENTVRVNFKWADLLMDKEVPASIKAELHELLQHEIVSFTDVVLFWSDYVQRMRMMDEGEYKTTRKGTREWCRHAYPIYPDAFESKFALTVYSYLQMNPDLTQVCMDYVYNTIFAVRNHSKLFCAATNWTIDKVSRLFKDMNYTTLRYNRFARCYLNNGAVLDDQDCFDLIEWLDESFLARITNEQLRVVKLLIKDCDKPTTKFSSVNDVERAHDARTEREVVKLAKNGLIKLEYHPDLEALAEKYEFTLPESNLAMIKRGKQHSNCVATYFDSHKSGVNPALSEGRTREVRRIFFTELATLELSIEYSNKGIVSTQVIQYKGRFNRDATHDDNLVMFRITLVGMPTEVLVVRSV
jgi:hypothetical protein